MYGWTIYYNMFYHIIQFLYNGGSDTSLCCIRLPKVFKNCKLLKAYLLFYSAFECIKSFSFLWVYRKLDILLYYIPKKLNNWNFWLSTYYSTITRKNDVLKKISIYLYIKPIYKKKYIFVTIAMNCKDEWIDRSNMYTVVLFFSSKQILYRN